MRTRQLDTEAFGGRLAQLRVKAGLQQAELAALVGSTQQTVSRWEAGLSRPRDTQMPRLAGALNADVEELLRAAGYSAKPVVTTFDQPFPIDALSPESYERFCRDLVQMLYPSADVHRAGSSGHAQQGIDIQARRPDGTVFTFQCKRVQEFGPQKVHAAIAKDTVPADRKFLLLSRVASPQTRAAIREHACWEIWDKDDISAKIRQLPKVDQHRLVDVYFNRRREELLGESEPGPWETTKEFFAPFENNAALFNHVWVLVGREQPTADLTAALDNRDMLAVFLVGSGGAGKTRILKQVIKQYDKTHRGVTVRFLSRTSEVTKRALEQLGSRPALIVVDDAHDRSDLSLLFQFVARRAQPVKLLLALRPYGLDRIKAQASEFSIVGSELVSTVSLPALTLKEAEELAIQVLKKYSGPLTAAKDIARLTFDCPLATVVGAQIVAKEKTLYDLAKNEDSFRTTLFGRFQDVLAGEIGAKADAAPIKKMLKILALLQPFHPEDESLQRVIEKVEGIPPHEAGRLIKMLTNAGVLFKRGMRYRISPDVLADYIVEANCVGAEGSSTGYAELVFSALDGNLIENLLVNLGKLDWVRSNGDASNSRLLDGVWGKLSPAIEYKDPHIHAVTAVAYYQPAKALDFAERLMRRGQFLNQLPDVLKYAAYNLHYVQRACADLWELGKTDLRDLDPSPNHAIRVLAELCEIRPNKPREYNEKIVEFGLGLVSNPESWVHRYTPLDVVAPILKTEGYTTGGNSRQISFSPFVINEQFVAELRDKVVDAIVGLLSHADTRIAALAARRIGEAIHYPMGMFGAQVGQETRDRWTDTFARTLEKVERAVGSGKVAPMVHYVVVDEVSWHAHNGPAKTAAIAKRIRRALPKSLDSRVLYALIDGYGAEVHRFDLQRGATRWDRYLGALSERIISTYPGGESLRDFIAAKLEYLIKNHPAKDNAAHVLCSKLISISPDLARAIIEDARVNEQSPTARFACLALARLWDLDVTEGRKIVERFFQLNREKLHEAIGLAFSCVDFRARRHGPEELSALKRLVSSDHVSVARAGIGALRRLAQVDPNSALILMGSANIGSSHNLADELVSLFIWPQHIPFQRLSVHDIEILLAKLTEVPELDGHWLETFLATASKFFPNEVARFFMRRVERAARSADWRYRPCNHGPYGHVPLRFKETLEYGPLLARVVQWIKEASYQDESKVLFDYRSRELFETMFGSYDGDVVQLLDNWSLTADKDQMRLISNILYEAPSSFVFTQSAFVVKLLERAKRLDDDMLQCMTASLLSSAVSGLREGRPGEPFPRDLQAKANAEAVLRTLSQLSPAYDLYNAIKADAERGIERARRDREAFED